MNYYCYRLVGVRVVVIEIDSIYQPELKVYDDSDDCGLGESLAFIKYGGFKEIPKQ